MLSKQYENVQREYEILQNRLAKLNAEKNGYISEIGAVKNSKLETIHMIKQQLEAAQSRMQENRIKLGRVEQIENAILKLYVITYNVFYAISPTMTLFDRYLETKDRGLEIVSNSDNVIFTNLMQKEIEELKKENPLVVIDAMKKNLRALLAFKDDYENELKDRIRRRKTASEIKLDELKKRMQQLEKETLVCKTNAGKAIQIRDEALSSKESIARESEETLNALEEDKRKMMEIKKNKMKEIQKLLSMLDRRDEILRHREIQMMKITQLQTQIEKNKTLHNLELNVLKNENDKALQEKEKQLAFYNKIKAEKKELQQTLKNLTTTLNSYKNDAKRARYHELQDREEKMTKRIKNIEQELKVAKKELEKKQEEAEQLVKLHEHLKEEAEEEAEKIRKRRAIIQRESEKRLKEIITKHYHDNMDRNPQIAAYYKKKLKDKEKEFADLTKHVRKMILADHTEVMTQKNHEMEIFELIGEIERIKRQTITRTVELDNKPEAVLRKRNQEIEAKLEDYENIKTQAKTKAVAFERLQELAKIKAQK